MRTFTKDDILQVNGWLMVRGLTTLTPEEIPKFGMIEDNVACGFLVNTDVNVAFLEAFITNPEAASSLRDKALRQISKWAIHLASTLGVKRVVFISKEPTLTLRGKDLGFKVEELRVGIKDL